MANPPDEDRLSRRSVETLGAFEGLLLEPALLGHLPLRPDEGLARLGLKGRNRRPIEPFELFTSEFVQNSVRTQENSSKIFRKILKFEKFIKILNIFSSIQRNSEKFSSESVQNSLKNC